MRKLILLALCIVWGVISSEAFFPRYWEKRFVVVPRHYNNYDDNYYDYDDYNDDNDYDDNYDDNYDNYDTDNDDDHYDEPKVTKKPKIPKKHVKRNNNNINGVRVYAYASSRNGKNVVKRRLVYYKNGRKITYDFD